MLKKLAFGLTLIAAGFTSYNGTFAQGAYGNEPFGDVPNPTGPLDKWGDEKECSIPNPNPGVGQPPRLTTDNGSCKYCGRTGSAQRTQAERDAETAAENAWLAACKIQCEAGSDRNAKPPKCFTIENPHIPAPDADSALCEKNSKGQDVIKAKVNQTCECVVTTC